MTGNGNGRARAGMNVGFHLLGGDTWLSGSLLLEGLLRAIRNRENARPQITLLRSSPAVNTPQEIERLADGCALLPSYKRWSAAWALDWASAHWLREAKQCSTLHRLNLDLVAFGLQPRGCRLPSLGFIWDFQHTHFPEMFSAAERSFRDSYFARVAEHANAVLLLSESVRSDYAEHFRAFAQKARVLRPVCDLPAGAFDQPPQPVARSYNLPDKFFYLPNQFWKHKNHRVVFEAVRKLKDEGTSVFVACTGALIDTRHPVYPSEVMAHVASLGIRDHVAILGVVPRDHVFQLMRQSVCVLNPSLFEGFGMTVEESRAIGKQLLVSDIPSHREQDPPKATFFEAKDVDDLATKMRHIWNQTPAGPDSELEIAAREMAAARIRQYAESFLAIAREAIESPRS